MKYYFQTPKKRFWSGCGRKTRSIPTGILRHSLERNRKRGGKNRHYQHFLTRMEQKGVISVRCEGEERFKKRRYFKAALNRQQYDRERARHLLDSYFDGSLNLFMSAFSGGEKLSGKEADELRKFLEDM